MRAHALVPVGSDGLSYAMNNNPTNYVGDYLWTANDLLGGGSSAPPEAQGYSRNFDTNLTTQKTLAATPGASTTNSDNAASAGSGAGAYGSNGSSTSYGSSGTTAYGSGSGGSSDYGPALPPGHATSYEVAGLMYIQTAGMIVAAGDDAVSKGLSNGMADQAGFLLCYDNSCVYQDLTTGLASTDPSAIVPGGIWVQSASTTVQTSGQSGGMPPELAAATDEALEDEVTRLMKVIAKLNNEIDALDEEIADIERQESRGDQNVLKAKRNQRLGKSLNRRDTAILLDGAQQRTGRSPTGNLVASSFTGFADINEGNTYANAWNEPWVQEGQTYCIYVAGGCLVVAGGLGAASYYGITTVGMVPMMEIPATLLMEGGIYLDIAAYEAAAGTGGAGVVSGGTGGLGGLGIASAGGGAVIVYVQTRPSSGTLTVVNSPASQAVMYRFNGLKGAQDYNLRPIQLYRCANDATMSFATGSEWYDHLIQQHGSQNVEWVSGSGRTITWPNELPLPENSQMFRVRPPLRSSTFTRDLERVAGPRPTNGIGHHNQPLGLNGLDNGLNNGSWQFNPAHQNGHNIINGQVNHLPYGTEFRILPRRPGGGP